ncbi:cohesin domain-containing protein [Ruminococcus champanellensis]|uniref:Cohesin domain n=1 Tax=Ruminococcus champanellensis (strain DSM 18848 / JCM 17042 / KCTC 15320 / 18P13) TaxID=213810 RepID=D4LEP5_RUMC1|nr:cohesin domain-containing protein [Ruminococcus champanellensis]CBL18090.1 Cohesin domain [Ruminococcus champanellensis 18P13 = JCM 17042]
MKSYRKKVLALALVGALAFAFAGCNKSGGKTESLTESELSAILQPGLQITLIDDSKGSSTGTTTAAPSGNTDTTVTTVTDANGNVFAVTTDANGNVATVPYVPPATTAAQTNPGNPAQSDPNPAVTTTQSGSSTNTPKLETRQALWMDLTKQGDFTFNGQFLTFRFKIKEGAQAGNYPISITHTDFCTYDAVTIKDIKTAKGYVGVNAGAQKDQAPDTSSFLITCNSVEGKPGDTVDVTFSISNNSGFAAFDFQFQYDAAVLEYVDGGAAKEFATSANIGMYP